MTRLDVEMALIQVGKAMQTIVGAYAPNANHMSVDVINGSISVSACEWDNDEGDYIEKDILSATLFPDGSMMMHGEYKPLETA